MSKSAIEARHLVVVKENQRVLDGLDFSVMSGTVTGLIGPSGSGKTTLMRAIVGVQGYSGQLDVLGKTAGHKGLRKSIGYVTQNPAVYPDLTVVQNLRYFATLVRSDKMDVDMVIEKVRLTKQRNQLVGSLSGGQKARVSLAVALLGRPELLVLDEPTVGLDPVLRNELWELFAELAQQGRTLLVSSHVMDEAARCKNILLLREGKLLWKSSLQSLLTATKKKDVGEAFITVINAADKAAKLRSKK